MSRIAEYKKTLAQNINITDLDKLESIISDEELKKYCESLDEKAFKPGERSNKFILDSHDFRYLESGEFKANLHAHTNNSDGLGSIQNLLDNANEIAEKNGEFIIAITDHDTIEGCKEAVKIICKSPEQYKKLKVVLGLEISTFGISFKNQMQPVSIHLLVYGINPFDTKLNEFLNNKRDLKLQLADKTINALNQELSQDLGYKFTLEEAALVHSMIKKGQDEIAHPLKKYTAAKILHAYYCPNAEFTYEKPIKKYKYMFKSPQPYYKIYKTALEKYIGKELPKIPEEIENYILKAQEIYSKSHPSIGRKVDAIADFEDTVQFISQLDYGYMSIAHPARTNASKINSSLEEFYTDLFAVFKQYGGEKACFYEGYYQSYEGEQIINWLPSIDKAAKKFNLIKTGGLDSHGLDVISRCPYT